MFSVLFCFVAFPASADNDAATGKYISDILAEIGSDTESRQISDNGDSPEPVDPSDSSAHHSFVYGTVFSLLPPVITICMAIATKEIFSSLFTGIIVGGLLYANFDLEITLRHVLVEGMIAQLSDPYNIGLFIFFVVLSVFVSLLDRSGSTTAVKKWAASHIKSKVIAQLSILVLGILLFIDEVFSCMVIGSVMFPFTKVYKISRAKLSYLIDMSAAPISILFPMSSWLAAVTSFIGSEHGPGLFMKAIPFNFYAILTIVMVSGIILLNVDFSLMDWFEKMAHHSVVADENIEDEKIEYERRKSGLNHAHVIDLLIPIILLVLLSVLEMLHSGGFFDGASFSEAISNANLSAGLVCGSVSTLLFVIIYYIARRLVTPRACIDAVPEGCKATIPVIYILTFAWSLKFMTSSLGAGEFISGIISGYAGNFIVFLPFILFLVTAGLAFATGTSWGALGILLPITMSIFSENVSDPLLLITVSACLSGSVAGAHCSLFSDTTILSASSAQFDYIDHVSTQFPYVVPVILVSSVCYLLAAFIQEPLILNILGAVIIIGILLIIRHIKKRRPDFLMKKNIEKSSKNKLL